MFILSGLILEVGEYLFRDFWSSFSISFVCFSARIYLRTTKPTMGRVLYKSRPDPAVGPSRRRPRTLTLARPRRPPDLPPPTSPPRRPAARRRCHRRPSQPPTPPPPAGAAAPRRGSRRSCCRRRRFSLESRPF